MHKRLRLDYAAVLCVPRLAHWICYNDLLALRRVNKDIKDFYTSLFERLCAGVKQFANLGGDFRLMQRWELLPRYNCVRLCFTLLRKKECSLTFFNWLVVELQKTVGPQVTDQLIGLLNDRLIDGTIKLCD